MKALLVGINKYPNAPLRGCVNDVESIQKFIAPHYTEIRTLTDEQATAENILEDLKWLTQTPPDSDILFHFSGHGVQVPDRTEADGAAEAICPVDFDWRPETTITDDELSEICSRIPSGVRFNFVSDSCHSGDLDRSFYASRTFPWPWASRKKTKARSLTKEKANLALLSACRSDQTAADTVFEGRAHGAFTYTLLSVLWSNPHLTLVETVAAVNRLLREKGFKQEAQASGTQIDRKFLNTKTPDIT